MSHHDPGARGRILRPLPGPTAQSLVWDTLVEAVLEYGQGRPEIVSPDRQCIECGFISE